MLLLFPGVGAANNHPIVIGLDADMSSASSTSGIAISRGAMLAIDEINVKGGVLGRKLTLEIMDHRGNPSRGLDNIEALGAKPDVVAVIGGIHTPVALHELPAIHKHKLIYLGAWAAGTPVVENGYTPNYVFRVSVRDEFAGAFLVGEAKRRGLEKIGLLLERTGWGRSNETAMKKASAHHRVKIVGIEWFNWGAKDVTDSLETLAKAGAQAVMLVSNPGEGAVIVRNMAGFKASRRLPIISHWGITGGRFFDTVGKETMQMVDLSFIQTFSFFSPEKKAKAEHLLSAYKLKFPGETMESIKAPVGIAHAYDLVYLLSLAISKAGSTNRPLVRDALENLNRYKGVMREYAPPFTQHRHDALTMDNFIMARYSESGAIKPLNP